MTTGPSLKNGMKIVARYHCPFCDAENSIWPSHVGKGRKVYLCSECKNVMPSNLHKIWAVYEDMHNLPNGEVPTLTVVERV